MFKPGRQTHLHSQSFCPVSCPYWNPWITRSFKNSCSNLKILLSVQYLNCSKSICYLLMVAIGRPNCHCCVVVMLIPCTLCSAENDGHSSSNTAHNSAVVVNLWFCWCTGLNQHYSGGVAARTGRHSELQVRALFCLSVENKIQAYQEYIVPFNMFKFHKCLWFLFILSWKTWHFYDIESRLALFEMVSVL